MKLLLVNTNRYRTPPVPPLGLEYLAAAVAAAGHECRVLDLCFAEEPSAELAREADRFSPDLAGLTVRNIDTVLRWNNEFFLDSIRPLVSVLGASGVPVILGGAGYSFVPEGIRRFLGADYGLSGPGEIALPRFLDRFAKKKPPRGTVIDGCEAGIDPEFVPDRNGFIDHARYVREGGLLGFETQKGCYGRCPYCAEGRGRVLFRNPERVADEVAALSGRGFREFHLCDTEFNQDIDHSRAVLDALIRKAPGIRWSLYLKTAPVDKELFHLLARSGAHLVTISIPTVKDDMRRLKRIRSYTRADGIRLAVDFLCGLPGDTPESVRSDIDTLKKIGPDSVGVNSSLRLLQGLDITSRILAEPDSPKWLSQPVTRDTGYIHPVFYTRIGVDMLRDFIGGDPRFTIEGFERTSNYERLRQAAG
jgi:radical SAM superfamily enzyme YgiQ (UPF0313 family)